MQSAFPSAPIRIGARASLLSVTQARQVQAAIARAVLSRAAESDEVEAVAPLVFITTTGDRVQDRRLLEIGGKALFTKEIEEALLDGRIDCAVHSLKDVPAESPPGLALGAFPAREDARDAFVSPGFAVFDALPPGARLGTASLRRSAQALHRRPDLQIVMLRGNVDTRLRKLADGECDATLLALSGLNRLGLAHHAREVFDPVAVPPAPGQGALAVQVREEDIDLPWVRALDHAPTRLTIGAERGALLALEGSCRTAIGAHARLDGQALILTVEALSPDGTLRFRDEGRVEVATISSVHALGVRLGQAVLGAGGTHLALPG